MKTLSFALLVLLSVSTASAEILYNVTDLGTIPEYDFISASSYAFSINNNGQIVGGVHERRYTNKAVLFDSTGSGNNIDLGYGTACSINNNGQIVGVAYNSGYFHATFFDSTGSGNNIDLGYGIAFSINNNGQIVGVSRSNLGNELATLFDSTGGGNNICLGALPGGIDGEAHSINDSGKIVGWAYDFVPEVYPASIHNNDGLITDAVYNTSGSHWATLFDITGAGNNINLGTLPGHYSSEAYAINNSGQIVGQCGYRATLFDITGAGNNIDLGYGIANSINNNGQIVGESGDRAMLFDITGSGNNIDLNTLIDPALGWTLWEAYCINDNGWIVGYGRNQAGEQRAFLLTPVPEPVSILLFGLGAIVLRKRNS